MNEDGAVFAVPEPGFEVCLAAFQIGHLVLDAAGRNSVHERLHEPVEFPLDLRKGAAVAFAMGIVLMMKPVRLPRVFLTEQVTQRRVHKVILQPFEYGGVKHLAPDGTAVIAGALVARCRAAHPFGTEIGETSAAAAAAHQAREQMARTAPVPVARRLLSGAGAAQRNLPRLDCLP
ncbi:MAG TPA: hypothetical protein VNW15_13355 [Rhizomicrobium sp.]|nr:hypothetical protein [Rhizomicrobium sp.]